MRTDQSIKVQHQNNMWSFIHELERKQTLMETGDSECNAHHGI